MADSTRGRYILMMIGLLTAAAMDGVKIRMSGSSLSAITHG